MDYTIKIEHQQHAGQAAFIALTKSMKFLVLSDLHLEFAAFRLAADFQDFDAVVLAGDIIPDGGKLVRWASRSSQPWAGKPVIAVPGNHEYYGGVMQNQRRLMRDACAPGVHVLDVGEVVLDGGRVRVLGATLWTDFRAPVLTGEGILSDPTRAIDEARRYMSDFRVIQHSDDDRQRRLLTPEDTLALHQAERAWLHSKLLEPFGGTTVVVTHHGPAAQSIAPQFADSWLTPSFVSDLPDEVFFEVPSLWIHGHTHTSMDYVRGKTRVICNPRGYRLRDGSFENLQFDPMLIVDASPLP